MGTRGPVSRKKRKGLTFPEASKTPPKDLRPEAVTFWQSMMQENDKRGGKWITAGDVFALKELCNVVADMHETRASLLVPDLRTIDKTRLVRIQAELSKQARAWLKEFGLTPAARARFPIPEGEEYDELEAILGGFD